MGDEAVSRCNVSALIVTALAAAMMSFTAAAQVADDVSEADAVEEIVVTGSRIKKRNLFSTSPVTQVDAEEFTFQGVTRVEDLLNDLPQVIADQSSGTNNGSDGIATVDLRGLQPTRTLTLLNGRRLPAGSPSAPVADVNQISPSAITGDDQARPWIRVFQATFSVSLHRSGNPVAGLWPSCRGPR